MLDFLSPELQVLTSIFQNSGYFLFQLFAFLKFYSHDFSRTNDKAIVRQNPLTLNEIVNGFFLW